MPDRFGTEESNKGGLWAEAVMGVFEPCRSSAFLMVPFVACGAVRTTYYRSRNLLAVLALPNRWFRWS